MLWPLFVLFVLLKDTQASGEWSYLGHSGPEFWCSEFPACCGKKQSPIDIVPNAFRKSVPFEFVNYGRPNSTKIVNNGHSVAVVPSSSKRPMIQHGGLKGKYILDAFHFHWGNANGQGSEHLVYGRAYPLEMHMVHYNSKFENLNEALNSGEMDALAVLGVLFDIGFEDNVLLDSITDNLENVKFKGDVASIEDIQLHDLLPITTSFYRYYGSLTTPSCDESVVWTVFEMPKYISEAQMNKFRQLYSTAEESQSKTLLTNNYRPVQRLNKRFVYLVN